MKGAEIDLRSNGRAVMTLERPNCDCTESFPQVSLAHPLEVLYQAITATYS